MWNTDRKPVFTSTLYEEVDDLVALWCLRALIHLGGHIEFMDNFRPADEVVRAIGFRAPDDWDSERTKKAFLKAMQKKLRTLEKNEPQPNPALSQNIRWLAEAMHLSEAEERIVLFAVLLSTNKALEKCIEYLGGESLDRATAILAGVLRLPRADVQLALSCKGVLVSSGLLNIEDGSQSILKNAFQLNLMKGFAQAMQTEHGGNSSDIFQNYFYRSKKGQLDAANFAHINDEYTLIHNYISATSKRNTKGVNILLHGQPGTGKTELIRTVAEALNLSLYEISMEDGMGTPFDARQRFASYQLAQNVLSRLEGTLILFDEIEDVFPCDMSIHSADNLTLKAWTNRVLETNPTPAFWLSNRIDQIDPAYLRRFDLILELKTPPVEVRHKILQHYFEGIPHRPEWIRKMSRMERLTPSHIESAAKVMQHLPKENIQENERILDKCLSSKLKTLGIVEPARIPMETDYRMDLLNSDYPLDKVIHGFKQQPRGSVCFYGPSGTGKSAFAHHLGHALGVPVLARKASDLLSPYVGGTESHISDMFQEAGSSRSILLLDEADSFLKERGAAKNSWEVTMVNELLVQMEEFDGIFICTTNLVDALDSASLRRFDLKIMFDFLQPEQAWRLFKQEFLQAEDEQVIAEARRKILAMDMLTPGDIALVKRQSRFRDDHIDAVIASLQKENQMKTQRNGSNRQIGFIASRGA